MKINLLRRTLVVGIILLFIGISVVPSSGIQIVEKPIIPCINGNTLYVGGSGPGNYSTIQSAVDDANNGDTVFVFDDSSPYFEKIYVNKSIMLVGENRNTTVIDGSDYHDILIIQSSNVTISNFTIQNSKHTGIEVQSNNNNLIIRDNNFLNNNEDIILEESCYNFIYNNYFNTNSEHVSIELGPYSCYNIISRNIIQNSGEKGYGMSIRYGSSYNEITFNVFKNNWIGMKLCYDFNIISYNSFESNRKYAINIFRSLSSSITCNNFIDNGCMTRYSMVTGKYIFIFSYIFSRQIDYNYWNDWIGFGPKYIQGKVVIPLYPYDPNSDTYDLPLLSFDWHPVKEPYNITDASAIQGCDIE